MKNIETKELKEAFKHASKLYSIFCCKNKDMELEIQFIYYALKLELQRRAREEQK